MGYANRRNEGGGGGGKGRSLNIRWGGRFRPPQNVTTKFRLLPGKYQDLEGLTSEYYQYVDHFVSRSRKFCICSKTYKIEDGTVISTGGKCLACQAVDEGAEDISWRLLHAFNGIHLAYYHLKPVIDKKTNKPMLYSRGERKGEQIFDKVPCEGRGCEHCKAKLEKVFGKKVHMSLGMGHLRDLVGFIDEIEKDCANCGEGRLEPLMYECAECAEPLIDLQHTKYTEEEIKNLTSHPMKCPSCDTEDYPLRQVECDSCQDPEPLSVFDCDLEIKRQGEGTNSTIQVPRWKPTELSKNLLEMAKPWPFKDIFAPDSFEWQAKVLKIKNPYASDTDPKRDYTDTPDFD